MLNYFNLNEVVLKTLKTLVPKRINFWFLWYFRYCTNLNFHKNFTGKYADTHLPVT